MVDKFFAIIVGTFILFSISMSVVSEQTDHVAQENVDIATTKFVDNIRESGYMSKRMYEDFIKKLQITGNLYDITLTCEHVSYIPVYTDDGVFKNDYQESYIKTYKKDILKSIYDDGEDFKMSEGDYFYVKVSSKNVTLATKVRNFIFHTGSPTGTITSYYGGSIRNEVL